MRVMQIPAFPRKFENPDLEDLLRRRLSQTVVLWPDQAIPLLVYMGWPNDPADRDESLRMVGSWSEGSESIPPRLGRIQHEWLRVADVFHRYCDLIDGQHQERRGGPSIGKAITLVEAKAKSRGTGAATLWEYWKTYKDVAHLVTAAVLICLNARRGALNHPFGPSGLSLDQFGPLQMVMLMPDLVLAAALEFERYGLMQIQHARTEPALDPETLWRIPPDMNIAPIAPPMRKLSGEDLAILNGAACRQSRQSQPARASFGFGLNVSRQPLSTGRQDGHVTNSMWLLHNNDRRPSQHRARSRRHVCFLG